MNDVRDPHDLDRFVRAQDGVYEAALAELRAGRKRSHWMLLARAPFPRKRESRSFVRCLDARLRGQDGGWCGR